MLHRSLSRPLWEPIHRPLDGVSDDGAVDPGPPDIVLSGPAGVFAGAQALVEGGTSPYTFAVNGSPTGVPFESPGVFPAELINLDEVYVLDADNYPSNTLVATDPI